MRAAVYHGVGDVQIDSIPDPGAPGPGEVRIAVGRAAICGTDSSAWDHGTALVIPGVVMGHEFAGRVEAVGEGVTSLVVGDRVVSGAGISCGSCDRCRRGRTNLCRSYRTLGLQLPGGLAEAVLSPASICRTVPADCPDDIATLAQPLAVALHAVRRSALAEGDSCIVIGVGGIGALVVAAAAARKPAALIAVDVVPARLERARKLGATETIDARGLDLAAVMREATGGEGAQVVLEASGVAPAPAAALAATCIGGTTVIVGLQAAPRELDLFDAAVREIDIVTTLAHVCDVDLPEAVALLATTDLGNVATERVIPLGALVDDGLRVLAAGTAEGKIVVDVTR